MIYITHTWRKPHKFTFHDEAHSLFFNVKSLCLKENSKGRSESLGKNVKWEKFVIWFSIKTLLQLVATLKQAWFNLIFCIGLPINQRTRRCFKLRGFMHEKLNVSTFGSCCCGWNSICWLWYVNKVSLSRSTTKILSDTYLNTRYTKGSTYWP